MTLGVTHLLGARKQTLLWLLATPFVSKDGGYPIGGGPA